MPRFTHPDTEQVIETAIPREAAELRSQGYIESKARTDAVRTADAALDERRAERKKAREKALKDAQQQKSGSTTSGKAQGETPSK